MLLPHRPEKVIPSNPHRVPFLNLAKLMSENMEEYREAFERVVASTQFVRGEELKRFESEFAEWVEPGTSVLGCANGTDAIRLAVRAMDLPPGSEAIAPAMTFFATVEPLLELGLRVKLVDIAESTWVMDPEQLARAITPRTRLIVPVHLYGQMANMEEIRALADRKGCRVLEDAAQAHGATWNGKPVGHFGHAAAFSFFPGKNLGALGDGGAVASHDFDLIQRARALGDHGGLRKYEHDLIGYNSRLDTIQAAWLRIKLKHIDSWNDKRRWVASRYAELLGDIPFLTLPVEHRCARSVYHLYVVLVQDRERFRAFLLDRGVETGVHYPKALHHQPAFLSADPNPGTFPLAEKLAAHGVSLPMCPTLTEEQIGHVSDVIHEYYRGK